MVFAVILGMMISNPTLVLSHGGKSHGGTGFSSLQAVQKATQLYDKLITSGKLTEEWETELMSISINIRPDSAGKNEYIVRFKRADGELGSVYFFFDQIGNYSGSNFSGE